MYRSFGSLIPVNKMERVPTHVVDFAIGSRRLRVFETEKPRWAGLFMWLGAPILESISRLIVSIPIAPNLTTDFPSGKFFSVDVGVSRSIADRANELVKVAGRKSLRILSKDLCRSNCSAHSSC